MTNHIEKTTFMEKQGKVKLFIENFLVYGFGGVISKVVSLVMVPLVTRVMPTSEYFGISDLSNAVVSFSSAIAVMGMYDAMYRMFFDKDEKEYKKNVCSTALRFTLITSVIVFLIILFLRDAIAQYFFGSKEYVYVVYFSALATLVGATNSIISAPTRMENKRKAYLILNTVSPLISYSIALPLLYAGYYVIALPLATVISNISLEISFAILNKKYFNFRMFDRNLLRSMLRMALPMVPNFLIYWIFNSCDKVMITNMIGIGAAGVYSVASKLGHASQLIYTAFAGGWQYFVFSTMKESHQVESNSRIFEYLGIISFVATAFICSMSHLIFMVLFKEDYLSGYIVAPYLFLSPLLQMLFQTASSQFMIIKCTWPTMIILLSGAVLNIFINYFAIPILGIEGASIATLMGYTISVILCVIVLCRMKLMVMPLRFIFVTLLMAFYMIVWRLFILDRVMVGILSALMLTIVFAFLYRKDLKLIASRLRGQKR